MNKKKRNGIRTNLYLDKAVFNALDVYATKKSISRSSIVNTLLKKMLEEEEYL